MSTTAKNTTATKTTKNVSKKEGTKAMTTKKTEKNAKTVETKATEKTPALVDKKAEYCKAVEKWIDTFRNTHPEKKVEVKTWEKLPAFYSIKIDGTLYFEIHASRNGVRPDAKSKYVPEDLRPEGWKIIKNGLDLYTPTQESTDILTVYAACIEASLAAARQAKEDAKAKAEAERKAKAEKKAAAKAAK